MGRRRRNRKKGKRTNVTASPRRIEQEIAKLRDQRRDEDRFHQDRKDVIEKQSELQRQNETEHPTEVHIKNIVYEAGRSELKDFLEVKFGAVKDVNLIANKKHPGLSKGFGFVNFVSPESAAAAHRSCADGSPPTFRGRQLKITLNPPKKGQRRPARTVDIPTLSFEAGTLRNKVWSTAWDVKEGGHFISFEIDGANRKLLCKFQYRGDAYEMRIYMKEVLGHIVLQNQGNGIIFFFVRLWRCPKLFREVPDTGWIRTVDPTSGKLGPFLSYRIGLSRSTPNYGEIINLLSAYHLVKEPLVTHPRDFITDCRYHSDVYERRTSQLPFLVRYELAVLALALRLDQCCFDETFFDALLECDTEDAIAIIRQMVENTNPRRADTCNLAAVFRSWRSDLSKISSKYRNSDDANGDTCFVLRAIVTPLSLIVQAQELEVKNRILRSIPRDRLLRLTFTDENNSTLTSQSLSQDVLNRIKTILDSGISVCGRRFVFLAYSSSQLKEHSCWMISETGDMTANSVRETMGDFSSIRIPGKVAARMGQCFSTTLVGSKRRLAEDEWLHIDDITRNGHVFSDGVGTISGELLAEVSSQIGYSPIPSAIQIRIGGVKGVLCHDPSLQGRHICTRPSQEKFQAPEVSRDLEICSRAQFLPLFINRQSITLMNTLGVADGVFLRLQEERIEEFRQMESNNDVALRVLRRAGALDVAQQMIEAGLDVAREPYLCSLLESFRAQQLYELQMTSRICVSDGCLLMGVMDEAGTLEYGQCFLQIQRRHESHPSVVDREVCVFKNPCLHPGDLLHLRAVDVPALRHLVNVLVFPQKGSRPHPNETSGGDLDGDLFSVLWHKDLIPPRLFPPMAYEDPPMPSTPATDDQITDLSSLAMPEVLKMLLGVPTAPQVNADEPVTIQDITKFFVNFIQNDNLGTISNAHLVIADASSTGACDPRCIELAKMASTAVDFPKTGVPAPLPTEELRPKVYPDFLEKKDKKSYPSQKAIGKMYRRVKELTRPKTGGSHSLNSMYDPLLDVVFSEGDVAKCMLEDAYRGREMYNHDLQGIMNQFGIMNEAEVMSGYVLKFSSRYSKVKKKFDVKMRVRTATQALEKRARQYFLDTASSYMEDDMDEDDKQFLCIELASCFYYVTYHSDANNYLQLLSFPWTSAADYLFAAHDFCKTEAEAATVGSTMH